MSGHGNQVECSSGECLEDLDDVDRAMVEIEGFPPQPKPGLVKSASGYHDPVSLFCCESGGS